MVKSFDKRSYDKWQRVQAARDERSDYNPIDWGTPLPKTVVNGGRKAEMKIAGKSVDVVIFDEFSPSSKAETSPPAQQWSRRQEKKARMQQLKEEQRFEAEQREVTASIREDLGFGDW
jgi:hypothetical protein